MGIGMERCQTHQRIKTAYNQIEVDFTAHRRIASKSDRRFHGLRATATSR